MQIGYREEEVEHMYLGKWNDLFSQYKRLHNFRVKKCVFEERKRVSLLDL